MTDNNCIIGIDVGGTFTDVVRLNVKSGILDSVKVPTDYVDPVASMIAGLELFEDDLNVGIESIRHATTLATNAILESKMPKTALLTTSGFRDILDIGRIQRPVAGIYDFNVDTPEPLVSRALRIEVTERMGPRGEVVVPIDEEALRATLRGSPMADVESIAVSCLFSFIDPSHERRIREIVREELPDVFISISSDVSPEIREFERTSTTVLDAALKPIMSSYLEKLENRMAGLLHFPPKIMLASGGLSSCQLAAAAPVNMVNSGPAAGVLASASLGRALGLEDLVTIDMGGTSLDIGLVEAGQPVQKFEGFISGYPMRVPMVDVSAVAAGGGSLSIVDEVGFIQVDRESAGSVPGPACYGRGGTRPTITDADLILGRLGTSFEGRGGFRLDQKAAERAFEREIAAHLSTDVIFAAAGALEIIQARMVKAIAAHTLEQGLDIRTLPLIVFGGAGPTHGVELADALGMTRVVIPYLAGSFSAVGLLLSPLRRDVSASIIKSVKETTSKDLRKIINKLDAEARLSLMDSGGDTANLITFWHVHLRYAGQSYDLAVTLGETLAAGIPEDVVFRLAEEFGVQHERRYAHRSDDEDIEIVQVRVSVRGEEEVYPKPDNIATEENSSGRGEREIYYTGVREMRSARVWSRSELSVGSSVEGPAVVEGAGSSALVPPGWLAQVDRYLNLEIKCGTKGSSNS